MGKTGIVAKEKIIRALLLIRGHKVMPDVDLADV
jgi:hypothetical protein